MSDESVIVRAPAPDDLDDLAANMRAMDVRECMAVLGLGPRQALEECVNGAAIALVAEQDGVVWCAWGLSHTFMPCDEAHPWMLCRQGIESRGRTLLAVAPHFLAQMRQHNERLYNIVHADNRVAQRFIKWCGFVLGARVTVGGEPFLEFHWEKS